MLPKEWHLWASHAFGEPMSGSIQWHIVHWDQRRTITVTFVEDPEFKSESRDTAIGKSKKMSAFTWTLFRGYFGHPILLCSVIEPVLIGIIAYLGRHIDNLGPDVHAITVSQDGELVTVSSEPYNDETTCPPVPALQALPNPRVKTVQRKELQELDRIVPNVDLISFRRHKLIFKYSFIRQHVDSRWNELNILLRLKLHPNIGLLDQVVVEELSGKEYIVGFTTRYIAGGSLDITHNVGDRRIFKLKWFKQLIRVVDDLNYKYGIQHQDIAPRNLLVYKATDQIMLIDFGVSARIGAVDDPYDDQYRGDHYNENLNDVEGVIFTLYEIITRDHQFRLIDNRGQNTLQMLTMKDWAKHPDVRLDNPVARYRSVLDSWVLTRKNRGDLKTFTDAPNYINWPQFPKAQYVAGDQDLERSGEAAPLISETYPKKQIERHAARRKGLQVINWQRPGQEKITEGMEVFADGTFRMSDQDSGRWGSL